MIIEVFTNALTIAATIGGVAATLWGLYMGWQKISGKEEAKLDNARRELTEVLESEVKAWKAKYELEHIEYVSYREKIHAQANETNSRMLQLVNENAALQAKTDMTTVTTALTKIMESLTSVTHILKQLEEKLDK